MSQESTNWLNSNTLIGHTERNKTVLPDDYMVFASVSRKDESGWTRHVSLPTFILNGAMQGITSEAHARDIADNMIFDLFYVAGVDSATHTNTNVNIIVKQVFNGVVS